MGDGATGARPQARSHRPGRWSGPIHGLARGALRPIPPDPVHSRSRLSLPSGSAHTGPASDHRLIGAGVTNWTSRGAVHPRSTPHAAGRGVFPGRGALEGEFCRLMRGSNHSFGLRIAAFEGRPFRRGAVRGGGVGIAARSADRFMKQTGRAHRGDRGGGSVCRGNRIRDRNGERTGVGAAGRGDRRIGRIDEKGEGGSDFRDFARMGNIVPRQTVLLLCFERRSRFRSSADFGIRGPSSSAPSFGRDAARL